MHKDNYNYPCANVKIKKKFKNIWYYRVIFEQANEDTSKEYDGLGNWCYQYSVRKKSNDINNYCSFNISNITSISNDFCSDEIENYQLEDYLYKVLEIEDDSLWYIEKNKFIYENISVTTENQAIFTLCFDSNVIGASNIEVNIV